MKKYLMKSMGERARLLVSDTAAFTISNFASKFLVFLLLPLYTSVLTTEEYGITDLITNTVNVVYPFLTLCIQEATLRFVLDKNYRQRDVLWNSLAVVAIAELVLIAAGNVVSNLEGLILGSYWIWFLLIFGGFNVSHVLSQYTKGIGKTKLYAVSGVIHTLVVIGCNILFLLVFEWGITGYLMSIVMGYAVTAVVLVVGGVREDTNNNGAAGSRFNWPLMKEMLAFSIPMIPTVIAWWINTSSDKYMITAYLGVAECGIYSVAYKIPSILTVFTNIFISAWTLSAIRNVDEKDNEAYQTQVYKYFNGINVIVCAVLILCAKPLGKLLFAKEFFEAWRCVPFLIVAYLFSGLSGFLASSFRAKKYTKGLLSSTIVGAVINVVLNLFVIRRYGIVGAAFTTMIGFIVVFGIRICDVKKIMEMDVDVKKDVGVYVLLLVEAVVVTTM